MLPGQQSALGTPAVSYQGTNWCRHVVRKWLVVHEFIKALLGARDTVTSCWKTRGGWKQSRALIVECN